MEQSAQPRIIHILTAEGTLVREGCGIEWAPDDACTDRLTFKQAQAAALACTLAGGGWHVASPKDWMLDGINHDRFNPASDLPDAKTDWYWTNQVDASSPAGYAVCVGLHGGRVLWNLQSSDGRVRFCRRVRASQF